MAKKIDENDEYGQKNLQKNLVIKDFGQKKFGEKNVGEKYWYNTNFCLKEFFGPKSFVAQNNVSQKRNRGKFFQQARHSHRWQHPNQYFYWYW